MRLILVIFILTGIACSNQDVDYKVIDSTTSYKLIEIGEDVSPNFNDVLFFKITIKNQNGDTIHYVPNYIYHLTLKQHYFDTIWTNLKIGDRITLNTKTEKIKDYFSFFSVENTLEKEVLMDVHILNSVSKNKSEVRIQEYLSKRELNEQLELKKYLDATVIKFDTINGIYRQIITKTDSIPIQFGSEVSIHYKGSFLDGFVFDDTYKKQITPSFTYGQEYQMIPGLKSALKGLKEGERIKIILPSRHAFGKNGSLAGIVPPYTAVIYDVKIIKVIN